MQVLGVSNPTVSRPGIQQLGSATVEKSQVALCNVGAGQPAFDPAASPTGVLVQVEAFSANFRDKTICLTMAEQLGTEGGGFLAFFGSEFCGKVVAVGQDVTQVSVGQRVIPDAEYPYRGETKTLGGIVTNHASRGWLTLDVSQVIPIPDTMSSVDAAGFGLGAQTAMSMVRRTQAGPGDRVLIMSGRANTSLFLAHCAVNAGAHVTVTSHSPWTEEQRAHLPEGVELREGTEWVDDYADVFAGGGYDVVLDPFFDLNLRAAVQVLDFGGRYATCGLQAQHPSFASEDAAADGLTDIMGVVLVKNLTLVGNCIGRREDLQNALNAHQEGKLPVLVDSVWTPDQGVRFVERTFTDRDRFGKVVMQYA